MASLSDRELVALFIRSGTSKASALDIADEVLRISNGLRNFLKLSRGDFIKISGIKEVKALELEAIGEMSRRIAKPSFDQAINIHDGGDLMVWLNLEIGYKEQEHFLVIFMNNQNKILSYQILFKGTVDTSTVSPRDVFRTALELSATRIILVHNHPGGTLHASQGDIQVTRSMVLAGHYIGIRVIDHVIVAQGRFISLMDQHAHLFEVSAHERFK